MPRRNKATSSRQKKTCSAKRKYTSEKQALEIAAYQMLLKPSLELGVYHCPHCGSWHLTNLGKK